MSDQEPLLSRWSRRKLQSPEDTLAEDARIELQKPLASNERSVDSRPGQDSTAETPILTDADMPDVSTLTEDSDFSPFMSAGVSDELRNQALRRLFRAPVFNLTDGLDEYDEDYTSFEKLGDIITCDMKHQMELEAKKRQDQDYQEDDAAEAMDDFDLVEDMAEDAEHTENPGAIDDKDDKIAPAQLNADVESEPDNATEVTSNINKHDEQSTDTQTGGPRRT